MFYPKNPYCPLNSDCICPGDNCTSNNGNNSGNNGNNGNTAPENGSNSNMTCAQMKTRISELEFALTDLNLYLDTHPNNKEALEMFTKLSQTLKSLMSDYAKGCEALMVHDVPNELPFQWASNKWPWMA